MIPDAYRTLFNRLLKRTVDGDVNWRPTADKNVVAVYFKEFSITLRRGWDQQDEEEFVRLEMINEDGEDIDGFYSTENDEDWREALALFEAARRKAIRLDEAVEHIMEQLGKDGPVGTEGPQENDDDLPF